MEFLGLYNKNSFFFLILVILIPSSCFSSFIADGIFDCHGSVGRNLLQTKQNTSSGYDRFDDCICSGGAGCPVNFEFQNYTIITSKCKGPKYPPELCCAAFKEFACPFAEELNDLKNECATTMFSYINLYGKYPPGLFASECREGKLGLECTNVTSFHLSDNTDASASLHYPSSLIMLIIPAFIIMLLL